MRKLVAFIALVAALGCFAAFASVAQASTTDSCVDFGSGPNNCFASTAETNVDFAQVQMGRNSFGTFTLVCRDRWGNPFVKQGNIGKGGRRSFFTEGLFGLRNPDCVLSAHANATGGKTARVTVTLVD
jgi:hypothetical protein